MILNQYPMPPLRPGQIIFDDLGRYVVPDPDSDNPNAVRHIQRTSDLVHSVSNTDLLDKWQDRMIVQGLAVEPQLLARVDLNQDKRALKTNLQQIAAQAFTASGAEVRRERGSQLHYFIEAVLTQFATLEQIPPEYRDEVRAAITAHQAAGIEIGAAGTIERTLYNREADVCGTADLMPVRMPNGMYLVDDWKTGDDLDWSWAEIAMQLAVYANADLMLEWDTTGAGSWKWVPAPIVEKTVALVAHVPVDEKTCDIYQIDIERGWRGVKLALMVRDWYSEPGKVAVKLDPKKWAAAEPALTGAGVLEGATFGADPFGPLPAEPGSFDGDNPATPVDEAGMSEIDRVRAELDGVKAEAANALEAWKAAGHKRRTKKMKQADELAEIAYDGEPVVAVFQNAIGALRDAYDLGAPMPDRTDDPDGAMNDLQDLGETNVGDATIAAPVAEPSSVTIAITETGVWSKGNETITHIEDVPVAAPFNRAVTDANGQTWRPAADSQGYTANEEYAKPGTVPFSSSPAPDGNPFAAMAQQPADLIMDAIEAAQPTAEAMNQLYIELADSRWTQAHTDRAQERIAEYEATVFDALEHCQTPADMSVVYENFAATGWSQRMTEHGHAVLAKK